MGITSNCFIAFLAAGLIIYYLVPKKVQWIILLCLSYIYYMAVSVPAVVFLLYSTLVTYGCALCVERYKRKSLLVLGLVLDFGMLAVLKYSNFMIWNINAVFRANLPLLQLLLPLGISYYTFSSAGYLLDVYWGRIPAEKNIFRFALFVSFFPQMIQGPINRFRTLGETLFAEHAFSFHRLKMGLERILWGIFKKMILADWAAVYVDAIFSDPDRYAGLILPGMILYAVQLYGDFSGGIDVMIGVAELFGVTMDENFNHPYFAVSLADFWRRWHMTLGLWMKDYVMYPLTLSKRMSRIGKACKKKLGRKKGRLVPICISNIIVFLLVGIWHGAAWKFIIWGLYNGLIIAVSNYFSDEFAGIRKKLHIQPDNVPYHIFMVIRTFIITMIGNYVDLTDHFPEMLKMLRYAATRFDPAQILTISSGKLGTGYTPYALITLFAGCLLLFYISFRQETGTRIREALGKLPVAVQYGMFLILLISIPMLAPAAMARGFIYAQF